MQKTIPKRNEHKWFLQNVCLLTDLTEFEFLTIADSLQEENITNGLTIFKQGESGDKFYIIKEGVFICSKKCSAEEEMEIEKLKNNSDFGEVSTYIIHIILLYNIPINFAR